MHFWTVHPRYLDDKALREVWRDGLNLRRAITGGSVTRASDSARRFLTERRPLSALDGYLHAIHSEARRRGRAFDASKLGPNSSAKIPVASHMVAQDWQTLRALVAKRSPQVHERLESVQRPHCHPAFRRVAPRKPRS